MRQKENMMDLKLLNTNILFLLGWHLFYEEVALNKNTIMLEVLNFIILNIPVIDWKNYKTSRCWVDWSLNHISHWKNWFNSANDKEKGAYIHTPQRIFSIYCRKKQTKWSENNLKFLHQLHLFLNKADKSHLLRV